MLSSNVRITVCNASGEVLREIRKHNRLTRSFLVTCVDRWRSDTPDRIARFRYRDGVAVQIDGYDVTGLSSVTESVTQAVNSTTVTATTDGAVLAIVDTLADASFSGSVREIAMVTGTSGGGTGADEVAVVDVSDDPIDMDAGVTVEVTWQIRAKSNRLDAEWALERLVTDDSNAIIDQVTLNGSTVSASLTDANSLLLVKPSSSVTPSAGTGISVETVGGSTIWEDTGKTIANQSYSGDNPTICLRPRLAIATLFASDDFDEKVPTSIADHDPAETWTGIGWATPASWTGDAEVCEGRLLGGETVSAELSMYDGGGSGYRIVFEWFVGKGDAPNEIGSLVGTPETAVINPDNDGDTDIDVITTGSEEIAILEGDLIQFATHTTVYEATADLSVGTSSSGNLQFTPGLTEDVPDNTELSIVGHSATAALDPLLVEVLEEDGGNDLVRVRLEPGVNGAIAIQTSTDGGSTWSDEARVSARPLIYGTPNRVEINIAADRAVWAGLNRQVLFQDLGTGTTWKPRLRFENIDPNVWISKLRVYLVF